MDSLNIPYLTNITNNTILHYATWTPIPTNIPSYIPKFDRKLGKYLTRHVMTFYLWCSSNSIVDDSIQLQTFQRNLRSHPTFTSSMKDFLAFFQLPLCHGTSLEIITDLRQTTSTHISNHIHEWNRQRILCKIEVTKELLLYWFIKSLFLLITKYVAISMP
jgi:hypothetical protein